MHCGEAQGDTMEACVHRMLYCSAVQSSVDQFRSGLWPKLNWEAPMGSDLVYSILSPEWKLIRPADKVRYWTAVAPVRVDLCRSEEAGSMEEAGSGHEDSSHNILTLDALQVLSRSQVTPGLSMSMRIRPICKVYIHTYISGGQNVVRNTSRAELYDHRLF
jgi:hypothetical protein